MMNIHHDTCVKLDDGSASVMLVSNREYAIRWGMLFRYGKIGSRENSLEELAECEDAPMLPEPRLNIKNIFARYGDPLIIFYEWIEVSQGVIPG